MIMIVASAILNVESVTMSEAENLVTPNGRTYKDQHDLTKNFGSDITFT